jgi:hypothetical protein
LCFEVTEVNLRFASDHEFDGCAQRASRAEFKRNQSGRWAIALQYRILRSFKSSVNHTFTNLPIHVCGMFARTLVSTAVLCHRHACTAPVSLLSKVVRERLVAWHSTHAAVMPRRFTGHEASVQQVCVRHHHEWDLVPHRPIPTVGAVTRCIPASASLVTVTFAALLAYRLSWVPGSQLSAPCGFFHPAQSGGKQPLDAAVACSSMSVVLSQHSQLPPGGHPVAHHDTDARLHLPGRGHPWGGPGGGFGFGLLLRL